MKPWAVRGLMALLLAVTVWLRVSAAAPQDSDRIIDRTRATLVKAGFQVAPTQFHDWLGGAVKQNSFLVASRPGCQQSLTVTPYQVDNSPTHPAWDDLFVYGDWQGRQPHRWRLLLEAARRQAIGMVHFRSGSPSTLILLVVSDPSACLTLGAPDWREIWDS